MHRKGTMIQIEVQMYATNLPKNQVNNTSVQEWM
jgi:hypothetical protein